MKQEIEFFETCKSLEAIRSISLGKGDTPCRSISLSKGYVQGKAFIKLAQLQKWWVYKFSFVSIHMFWVCKVEISH
jgi:hypothetical protein